MKDVIETFALYFALRLSLAVKKAPVADRRKAF